MDFDFNSFVQELHDAVSTGKKKTSISVSEATWEAFKGACGALPPSTVLERFMEKYVAWDEARKVQPGGKE